MIFSWVLILCGLSCLCYGVFRKTEVRKERAEMAMVGIVLLGTGIVSFLAYLHFY